MTKMVWLVLWLLGCGSAHVAPIARAHKEVTEAHAAHSLWRGRYECAQGATALTLTLDLSAGGQASAVFDFGPLPENPSVPTGRYLMRGTFVQSAAGTQLVLTPDRWVARPGDYEMVGMHTQIDAAMTTMRGRIDYPSCSVVSLTRVP